MNLCVYGINELPHMLVHLAFTWVKVQNFQDPEL